MKKNLSYILFLTLTMLLSSNTRAESYEEWESISYWENMRLDDAVSFIKNSQDINHRGKGGATYLTYAASGATNPQIIKMLIEKGAEINAQDNEGWTALMSAARQNTNPAIVQILLENGADTTLRKSNNWSALMLAAAYNPNPKVTEILIEHGTDVNENEFSGGHR